MSRVIETDFIIAPVASLDIPMETSKFAKEDGSYMTVNEYCEVTSAQPRVSNDGRYFLFGHELSDLDNDISTAKVFALKNGLQLGGRDFTRADDGLVWILNYSEVQKFLAVNPMFKDNVEEVLNA